MKYIPVCSIWNAPKLQLSEDANVRYPLGWVTSILMSKTSGELWLLRSWWSETHFLLQKGVSVKNSSSRIEETASNYPSNKSDQNSSNPPIRCRLGVAFYWCDGGTSNSSTMSICSKKFDVRLTDPFFQCYQLIQTLILIKNRNGLKMVKVGNTALGFLK